MSDASHHDTHALDQLFQQGLAELGLQSTAALRERVLVYIALMLKWNKRVNLTSIRDPQKIITRHILDSLSVLPYIQGKRILDVGSGAGLPGVPLAFFAPDKKFYLIDRRSKKTHFLVQVVQATELKNIQVVNKDVEEYHPEEPFDTIVARAFSDVRTLIERTQHLARPGTHFLVMKGIYPHAELEDLPAGYRLLQVAALKVPGLDEQRHVAIVEKERVEKEGHA